MHSITPVDVTVTAARPTSPGIDDAEGRTIAAVDAKLGCRFDNRSITSVACGIAEATSDSGRKCPRSHATR